MEWFKNKKKAKINELIDQRLKLGKLFQHGDNLTICGNPVAMLYKQAYGGGNACRFQKPA